MSRLFAKYLMNRNGIEPDELARVFENANITGKYLASRKEMEFKVLDFYGYKQNGEVNFLYVKISEPDLLRMISIDSYSKDEQNEMYYHELLHDLETNETIDDDTFYGISIIQYFFHVSKNTIKELKRAFHRMKLYRQPSKAVLLRKRVLHSNGGRPKDSKGKITEEERYNLDNRETIIRKCIEHDWYNEFMDLHKLMIRTNHTQLSLNGAKWKFYILRYQYKVEHKFISRDKDYEKQLINKNNQYKIFDNLDFSVII